MGNKASRPTRKLANTISKTSPVTRSSQAHLPTEELKAQYEKSTNDEVLHDAPKKEQANTDRNSAKPAEAAPNGRDGMDPSADQAFINSINKLGRQIQSHSARNPSEQLDVMALKQLLNRKKLYEKGQKEVKAQLEAQTDSRTMIHPRTLTAVLNALNEHKTPATEVMKDYQVSKAFLENLDRFKVANNIVIIEEDRKDDEIGPKVGQPAARAATQASMIDYDGEMTETVNTERVKKLRSRLE